MSEMSELTQMPRCRCGETMMLGSTTALGLVGGSSPRSDSKLLFVLRRERTSVNPVDAFKQGLQNAPANEAFRLQGYRCPACGRVELFAKEQIAWPP